MRAAVDEKIGASIDADDANEVAFDKLVSGYWQ